MFHVITNQQKMCRLFAAITLFGFPVGNAWRSARSDYLWADTGGVLGFAHVTVDDQSVNWSGSQGVHIKTIGDLNGDGYTDLVVAGSLLGEPIVWYESPVWTKHTVTGSELGGWSTDAEVGDVDNDGDQDIVISSWYRDDPGLEWFENTGAGISWIRHVIGPPRAHDMELADFDLDGDLDIVTRQQESAGNKLEFWRQDAPDTWTHRTLAGVPVGEGLIAADIDQDADTDVIISGIWYENTRDIINGVWIAHTFTTTWTEPDVNAEAADINRDGRTDIVLTPSESAGQQYHISWFEAPADPTAGNWAEHVVDDNTECVLHSLRITDIDKDGDLDVVTAEMHQGEDPDEVRVYINEGVGGVGTSWAKQVIATSGSHFLRVGDFDRDGDNDIFGANWTKTSTVDLWRNDLNTKLTLDNWERHVVDSDRPWKAIFITAGDMDRDGHNDIVTGGWWYHNPGSPSGTWIRHTIGSPLNNLAAIYDYDRDGDLDILGTPWSGSGSDANFHWARNDGAGTFTILNNITSGEGDFLQGVAVARFQPTGSIETALSWHAGTGNGIQMLTTPAEVAVDNWPWRRISDTDQQEQLSAGDIDRDGDLDLLLGTAWLRNDNGAYTLYTLFVTSDQPDRNRLADINKDGRLDAVVGYLGISTSAKVVWYEQPADPTTTWTEHLIADLVGPMSLDVADIDRDGDLDVVVGEHNLSDPASARLLVLENVYGVGTTWQQHTVYVGDEHHDGAQLVDIDNDGDLDIISIGWSHSNVVLYENKATVSNVENTPPTVDAGPDQIIMLPSVASLDGTVVDDGLPSPPGGVAVTWSKISGPGTVTFGDAATEDTIAEFGTSGTYVLQLEANDGEFVVTDPITLYVFVAGERITESLTVLYTFQEERGTTVNDVSDVGTPLNLTIAEPSNVTWGENILSVDSPTLISSDGAATKLYDAITTSNEIAIEAWITPANVTQDGPARIVTLSADLANRNFTLGQGQWGSQPPDVIDVRLRTTSTNNDGEPSLTTPAGSITVDLTHLVYTRDSTGNAKLYMNNVETVGAIVNGDVSNWDSGYAFALANELTGDRPWLGTFHLVAVYNRALSPTEVNQNFVVGPPSSAEPPILSPLPNDIAELGVPYDRTPSLMQGTPPITWSLIAGPTGMMISSQTGKVSWTDPQPLGGSHLVHIEARNSVGGDEAIWTLTVSVLPPLVATLPDDATEPGVPYRRTPTLVQGTPPNTWSLATGPGGMTVDPATGEVSWPNPQPLGSTHAVRIRASNSSGNDEASWTLTVSAVSPLIADLLSDTTTPGVPYSRTPSLAQGTPPITWSLAAAPAGMAINSATGEVTWPDPQPPGSSHTVAIDAANSTGSDRSSWTLRVLGPAGFFSDDFNTCSLDTALWNVVDPLGDATFTVSGVASSDAIIAISLPEGTSHDVWIDGNNAARLMQTANDTDFEIGVKFDTPMTLAHQIQGLIIQQDEDHFLRFDFYSTNDQNWIFAVTIWGGSASIKRNAAIPVGSPLHMSLARQGNRWTQRYSYDGVVWIPSVSFEWPMTVTAVGPFVGNANCAFTGIIDYFFNSANPIDPEDGTPAGGPGTALTINTAGDGNVVSDPDQSIYYCNAVVALAATAAPGSRFVGWSGDATGDQNPIQIEMSRDRTVTALFLQDVTIPPVVAAIPNESTGPGTSYNRTPSLTQGTPPIAWSLLTGPSGMTIQSQTGQVNWPNPQPPDSSHPILIEAANLVGSYNVGWVLSVSALPPVISAITDDATSPSVAYARTPALAQGSSPVTWSLVSGPPGMTIHPGTGEVSWSDPQPPGSSHSIAVSAFNSAGTDTASWTLMIDPLPPIISVFADDNTAPGVPYSRSPTLAQGTPPITWSLITGPPPITIEPTTGIVNWPDPQPPGTTHTVSIAAANQAGSDQTTWTLVVDARPPVIAPLADAVITPGVLYNQTPTLIQGTAPITWFLVAGPSGITVDSATGQISWPEPQPPGSARPVSLGAANSAGRDVASCVLTIGQRVFDGLTVLYDFAEGSGSTVNDVSGIGVPMNLTIADPSQVTWLDDALSINSSTIVSSNGAATKLFDAITASNEITIEAWLTPANVTQDGPARVVTMSANTSNRNFTLGQGLWGSHPPDVINVRLRTTATNSDGEPSVTTAAGAVTTDLMHVVYRRNASGSATVYIDNVERANATVQGDLTNWNSGYAFALANELTVDRPWLGTFHLVAVYDQALSAVEVNQNYIVGPPRSTLAPCIATLSDDATTPGEPYSRTPALTQGALPITWSLVTAPAGITLNATTGELTWPDPQPPASSHPVRVKASNAVGSYEAGWTLTVSRLPPIIATVADHATAPSMQYTRAPTLTQGTPPIAWSLATGPAAMTIHPATGQVSWLAPQPPGSSHPVSVIASNSAGSDVASWTLTVDRLSPIIAHVADHATAPGALYNHTPTLAQGTAPMTWSLVNGPAGMTITTTTGELSWPDAQPPGGSFAVTVEVSNSAGSDQTSWTLNVNALPPIIAGLADDATDPYVAYSRTPTLTQGTPLITWSLRAAPSGTTIDPATGEVNWANPQPPGSSFAVTIEAGNAAGDNQTTWTLNVNAIPPVINTLSDDSTDPGVAYSKSPTLAQGTAPITWAVLSGPAGLTIDAVTGAITWANPQPPGSSHWVTITATNAGGCHEASWMLAVNALPPIIQALADDDTPPGTAYSRSPTLVQGTPPITWSLVTGPANMTIDASTGEIGWPPPQAPGSVHTLSVSATNIAGSDVASWTLTVWAWTGLPSDTDYNWRLDVNEVTVYGLCWKTGCAWSIPPDPIPIAYASRTGFLWRMGEWYHNDSNYVCDGVLADCFRPGAEGGAAAAMMAPIWSPFAAHSKSSFERQSRRAFEMSPTRLVTDNTQTENNHVPDLDVRRSITSENTGADRHEVQVKVTPPPSAEVWAIEELPPSGWSAVDINEGGLLDTIQNKVKWGPFFDIRSRTLCYTMIRPDGHESGGAFAGVISVDGVSVYVAGDDLIEANDSVCRGQPDAEGDSSPEERGGDEKNYANENETPIPFMTFCGTGVLKACLMALPLTLVLRRGAGRFGVKCDSTRSSLLRR